MSLPILEPSTEIVGAPADTQTEHFLHTRLCKYRNDNVFVYSYNMVHFNNIIGLTQMSHLVVLLTDGDRREVEFCRGCCHEVLHRVMLLGFVQGDVMRFCTGCSHEVLYRVMS